MTIGWEILKGYPAGIQKKDPLWCARRGEASVLEEVYLIAGNLAVGNNAKGNVVQTSSSAEFGPELNFI
jgi:hypothetical protein